MRTCKYRKIRRRTRRSKGGASNINARLPLELCSVDPDHMPAKPEKPLIEGDEPFPRPWAKAKSDILFVGLVVSESSPIGKQITSIASSVDQKPFAGRNSAILQKPHLSLCNVYVPTLGGKSLHSVLTDEAGFASLTAAIASLIKTHITDKKPTLLSIDKEFQSYGKFVVKKYTKDTFSHYRQFLAKCYYPFKEAFVSTLGGFIERDVKFRTYCYPAYFPPEKQNQSFRHYSGSPLLEGKIAVSDFAISRYFENDLSPHISLIKSNDEAYKMGFIENLKQIDTRALNVLEISKVNFSSIFISYMGKWVYIDL